MNYLDYVRSQVTKEDWRLLKSRRDINLDAAVLYGMWADFVNFEKRRRTEIPFLVTRLAEYDNPRIFDASLGSGATTFGLKLAGLEKIVANETDSHLANFAKKEAKRLGIDWSMITVTSHDWRKLPESLAETFDAVVSTGNSLTYLFKKGDQLAALQNFRDVLKPRGKLIIDERNYAEHFLKAPDGSKFRWSGDFVYCGKDRIAVHPIHISQSMVVVEYAHLDGRKSHLALYPFKRGELKGLLREAGFREISMFGDYRPNFRPQDPEFLTYVCCK
ncbi:class I SAM-dependent methyltransferase [Candidatus Woesearchaeota archaeon]|nr:class I SAM-dependent methyltransferase [Candidatus Woesearchaeota archaeon]